MTVYEKYIHYLDLLPDSAVGFFMKNNDVYQLSTKLAYASDLQLFFEWMLSSTDYSSASNIKNITVQEIAKLDDRDIDAYMIYLDHYRSLSKGKIMERENQAASKSRKLSALREYFRYLLKTRTIPVNPTDLVNSPKLRRDKAITILSKEQKERMLDESYNGNFKSKPGQTERGRKKAQSMRDKTRLRDTSIIALFFATGLRVSELININLFDMDFNERSIMIIRKGGGKGLVYFNDEAGDLIQRYLLEERPALLGEDPDNPDYKFKDGPLFIARGGNRITKRRVQQIVEEYSSFAVPANMKVGCHVLRKTFGTEVNNEYDLTVAQQALGHADSSTTSRYYAKFDMEKLKDLRDKNL